MHSIISTSTRYNEVKFNEFFESCLTKNHCSVTSHPTHARAIPPDNDVLFLPSASSSRKTSTNIPRGGRFFSCSPVKLILMNTHNSSQCVYSLELLGKSYVVRYGIFPLINALHQREENPWEIKPIIQKLENLSLFDAWQCVWIAGPSSHHVQDLCSYGLKSRANGLRLFKQRPPKSKK